MSFTQPIYQETFCSSSYEEKNLLSLESKLIIGFGMSTYLLILILYKRLKSDLKKIQIQNNNTKNDVLYIRKDVSYLKENIDVDITETEESETETEEESENKPDLDKVYEYSDDDEKEGKKEESEESSSDEDFSEEDSQMDMEEEIDLLNSFRDYEGEPLETVQKLIEGFDLKVMRKNGEKLEYTDSKYNKDILCVEIEGEPGRYIVSKFLNIGGISYEER